MSGEHNAAYPHAETVRRYIKAEYPPQPSSSAANQAEDSLDALERERDQAVDALRNINNRRWRGVSGHTLTDIFDIAAAALAEIEAE